MRRLKKILLWAIIVLVVINVLIVATDNVYLYKTFYYQTAGIDDYQIFDNRTVSAGTFVPISDASGYNKTKLSEDFRSLLERYHSIAFLILKNDSVAYEEYWDGYNADSYSNSFSITKSIVSILTGIAIDEQKIKNIDQKVSDFIPEYKEGLNAMLTVRHLLTMSAGFDFSESYSNPFSLTARIYYGNDLDDVVKKIKVTQKPGVIFNYQSISTLVLAFVLRKATGMTLAKYASEKLWKPLGAKHDALWSLDNNNGVEKAYCCFNSNALDFSRIGLLYLHKGMFHDKQIISEEWVNESVQSAPLLDENGYPNDCYGYSWWFLNCKGEKVFYAKGILGQYIIVIPSKNIVAVRLGEKKHPGMVNEICEYVFENY